MKAAMIADSCYHVVVVIEEVCVGVFSSSFFN